MIKTPSQLLVLFLVLALGCGDGGAAVLKRRNDLAQLGAAYLTYHKLHGHSPSDATELLEYMGQEEDRGAEAISAENALQEGDVIMVWKAEFRESATDVNRVLGFEAAVPARGGYVVMGDGSVRVMKRSEFEATELLPSGQGSAGSTIPDSPPPIAPQDSDAAVLPESCDLSLRVVQLVGTD